MKKDEIQNIWLLSFNNEMRIYKTWEQGSFKEILNYRGATHKGCLKI